MKASVKLSSNVTLEIEEQKEMETLHKAIVFSSPRSKCNLCGNVENFYFTTNKDKEGNIYINNKCRGCGARSKLGQYKVGGYFWHEFEEDKFKKEEGTPEPEKTE